MTNKTKELVAAGHALAKELHCAESAALVRELATQLDVQLSRSNALAAENAGLKAAIETHKHGFVRCNCCGDELMCHTDDVCRALDETPATDSFLAEVRAQGVEMFSEKFGGGTLLSNMVKETAKEFAAQLRKGVQS